MRYLARDADIVLVEGAGSPAEINLRAGDIANMGFAAAADVPVVMLGDIDRGGVIASLAGTHLVLEPDELRADPRLHRQQVSRRRWTVRPGLAGDHAPHGLALARRRAVAAAGGMASGGRCRRSRSLRAIVGRTRVIAVPVLARIANFDDLDPLGMEPGVKLVFVRPGEPIPAEAEIVILPGSKSTIGDLAFLRAQGWDIDIKAHVRRGGHVLGLCGGYQMLGRTIADPDGVDGRAGTVEGLGLLDITTVMTSDKSTTLVSGRHCATGAAIRGYEIHLGRSEGGDCARPLLDIDGRADGASSADGRVQGTYVHGLFTGDAFRKAWLGHFGIASSLAYEARIEEALDALADHLEAHLDIEQILKIARSRQTTSASAA